MTTNTATARQSLQTLIGNMADTRRELAAKHGITMTEDDIADSIKAALLKMMAA
jgi:hypothetical protein